MYLGSSRPLARKHDASGVGGFIDLRPVPRLKRMNASVLSLGLQVLGDEHEDRGRPSPRGADGKVRAPEIRELCRIGCYFIEELVGHLRKGRTGARPLAKVLVHNRCKELVVRAFWVSSFPLHLAALEVEQPGKLLRACEQVAGESLQILVREKLDKFGGPVGGDSP